MLSLQEFKSNIDKYGLAYPSRFDIIIVGKDPEISQILSARCDFASIPGLQVLTTSNKLYGGHPDFNIPNGRKYDEVQLTFTETSEFKIKSYFEDWYTRTTNMKTGQVMYYDNICNDIIIKMYDNTSDEPVYEIKLINAIPTRTEMINLDWADHDRALKLSVNFSYRELQTNYLKPFGVE